MNTALVTGTIDRFQVLAMALKREGFDARVWDGPTRDAADGPAPGSVDCYVQLPPDPSQWSKPFAGPLLAAPLVHRLDMVAAAAPLLAPDAAVVLVVDEPGWEPSRRQALRGQAEAAVAERVGPGRRVAVIDSGDAGCIAAAARREWTEGRMVSLADLAPGLAYTDWRNEVINLTSGAEIAYFGWQRPDGARRAGVLRRSVLSALPGADGGPHGLARAVLTDALGASALADLQQWDTSLVEDFLHEVIRPLPTEGFELSIRTVATWMVRRSLSDASSRRPEVGPCSKYQTTLGLRTVAAGAPSGQHQPGR